MAKDSLKAERLQILNMLKDGTITADEAARLLDALESSAPINAELVTKRPAFKMIKILIDGNDDGEEVKVRMQIPVEFAKLLKSARFSGVNLDEYDIDIDALINMIDSGALGEIINIQTDEVTVRIVVE